MEASFLNPATILLFLIFFALASCWICGIVWLGRRRRWIWMAVVFLIGGAGPFWVIVFFIHPFGPVDRLRILDRAETADHTQLILTQSRNDGWTEPYTISFYVKPPGKPWGWGYIDHESGWMRSGKVDLQSKPGHAVLRQGNTLLADYDLGEMTYNGRTLEWKSENWEPGDAGKL